LLPPLPPPPNDGDWIHPELTNFTAIYLSRF
jgi:hypothetical protein